MTDYTDTPDLSIDFSEIPVSNVVPVDGFVEQGGRGWYDTFVARKITFPDGQCEILVQREKHFAGPALSAIPKAKRGESENRDASEAESCRRAKKNIRQRAKAIGADRLLTLTYRDNVTERERALKDWKNFARRMGKCKAFHYVAVMETQERGAIHFHVAVRGRLLYALVRSIWQSVVGKGPNGEKMGQINVREPHKFGFGKDGVHKLAAYISKYISKQLGVRDFNEKRYFTSRGIVVPEVRSWRLVSSDMLSAVEAAFAVVADHKLDGLQMWCNNALGLVWLASAPGLPTNKNMGVPF